MVAPRLIDLVTSGHLSVVAIEGCQWLQSLS